MRHPLRSSRALPGLALLCLACACGKAGKSPPLAGPPSSTVSAPGSAAVRAERPSSSADLAIVEQLRADNVARAPAVRVEVLKLEDGRVADLRLTSTTGTLTSLTKLSALGALRRLSIQAIGLEAASGPQAPLGNLESLAINGPLGTLPEWVTKLPKLQQLSLVQNGLANLPASLAQLQSLRQLQLSNNDFTTIPAAVFGLRELETLKLTDSRLTTLPDRLRDLQRLRTLNLAGNQLTELAPAVFELSSLETLTASKNQLKTLSPAVAKLKRLSTLRLHDNQLTTLPLEIGQISPQYLTIERNRILNADALVKRIWGREAPPTWAVEPQITNPLSAAPSKKNAK